MNKTDVLQSIQDVLDASNQSWIRRSAREYIKQITECKSDQKAYEVAQEAMMMFGMSTSDRAVKTLVQAFLVSARIAKERS